MTTNEPTPSAGDASQPGGPTPPSYGSTPEPPVGNYPVPPAGGYPPPGGYPRPGAPGGYNAGPQGNKKALWSMIVGIASLVLGLFCGFLVIGSVVAVVLGFISRKEIAASNGTQTGSGQALTGIITGFVLIGLFIVGVVLLATGVIDYNFSVEG